MKYKIYPCLLTFFSLCIGVIFISGCSPSESAVQTAIAETDVARPTYTKPPTLTPTKTNTPTETPIPSWEMTQTAISEFATGTAEANIATQTAMAAQSTSTRQAYDLSLTATAAAHPSSTTFLEIESNYYNMEDEQWNDYRSSLKGEIIQWTGKILDKTFDTLLIDMGQYAPDRLVALHKVPTATVDKLNIGNTVSFIAIITDITFYSDVQLNLTEMK